MMINFSVPGIPVPWARARQNGKRFFTDPKVQAFKDLVTLKAKEAGAKPLENPCHLVITCYLPIPASWPKKDRQGALEGLIEHTSKPDWDNLGKGFSDALNGCAWKDDSQVVWANVKKVYSEEPRSVVTVRYLEDPQDPHAA